MYNLLTSLTINFNLLKLTKGTLSLCDDVHYQVQIYNDVIIITHSPIDHSKNKSDILKSIPFEFLSK